MKWGRRRAKTERPFAPVSRLSKIILASRWHFRYLWAVDSFEFFQATNQLGDGQALAPRFDWVFWTLIAFNVFALAYVRTVHGQYIRVLFRTGIYNRQIYQNTQEDLRLGGAGSVLLTIAYFNCVALVVGALLPAAPVWLPFVILGVVTAVVVLKYGLMKLVSYLTQTREGISEHWMNHLIFFQICGILLTPVLCFTHFSAQTVQNDLMLVLAAIIAGSVFLREIQTFLRVARLRIPMYYIILYLCTLEIIPVVVIIKALVN